MPVVLLGERSSPSDRVGLRAVGPNTRSISLGRVDKSWVVRVEGGVLGTTEDSLCDTATRSRSDDWKRIEHLLPGRPGQHGKVAKDNRLFLDAVLRIA